MTRICSGLRWCHPGNEIRHSSAQTQSAASSVCCFEADYQAELWIPSIVFTHTVADPARGGGGGGEETYNLCEASGAQLPTTYKDFARVCDSVHGMVWEVGGRSKAGGSRSKVWSPLQVE